MHGLIAVKRRTVIKGDLFSADERRKKIGCLGDPLAENRGAHRLWGTGGESGSDSFAPEPCLAS